MARQYKKILKKLQPKTKSPSEQAPPEKPGKDYLLTIILALTVIFLIIGWSSFTAINRGLYITLIIALGSTYARRHYKFNATQDTIIEKVGYAAMGLAIVLFVAEIYFRFIS